MPAPRKKEMMLVRMMVRRTPREYLPGTNFFLSSLPEEWLLRLSLLDVDDLRLLKVHSLQRKQSLNCLYSNRDYRQLN
jgi:hypothetical protein